MHRFSIPFGMHNNNNTNYTANGWGINGWNDGTTVMKSIEKNIDFSFVQNEMDYYSEIVFWKSPFLLHITVDIWWCS